MLHWLAALPVLIWAYLLLARGGFWRVRPHLPADAPGTVPARRVVAVIPARDEADTIGMAVRALLEQDYAGELHVIVVDDGSRDGTAQIARAAAGAQAGRLQVLTGAPLPTGWTGKLWALSQGVQAALVLEPDYLLFTDADIDHARGNIRGLVARAEAERRDLVSSMVCLSIDSFAERCLIPAFVFFFFKLYPPRWIASARHRTAGAAGGCVLIRPAALERAGGIAALRGQIIDDCALARAVKDAGGSVWLGLTQHARSLRRYGSFAQIGSMISRTAFNQLHHSYLLLAGTVLGLACTYLLAPVLLLTHDAVAVALGAAAWLLMALAYLPIVRFYGLSPLWSLALPAVAAFYSAATLHSALQYRLGRGGVWKGRVQDIRT